MEPSPQPSSVAVPIAIVAGFSLIALAIYFSGIGKTTVSTPTVPVEQNTQTAQKPASSIKPVDETDYIRGNQNAPILIVEYSDYDCPFCKSFHETMNLIMDEYGVSGKVAWVYRQFPIAELHPNAPRLSKAALCVGEAGGNDAFWKFSDSIFMERGTNEQTNVSRLEEYATKAGVSSEAYRSCMESNRHEDTIANSLREASEAGIRSTPNSFVIVGNQQVPIEGAIPYEGMKLAIQNLVDQLEGTETTSGTAPSETDHDAGMMQ